MANVQQPWLPKVKVPRVISQEFPQPKLTKKIKAPRKFEILYHPFDLRFRGRISKWLEEVLGDRLQVAGEILNEDELEIIKLYFFSQGEKKKWLNQEEVLQKTKIPYKKKLKMKLVESLMKIWLNSKI